MKNLILFILLATSCSVFGQTWEFTKSVDDFTDKITIFAGCFGEGEFPYNDPVFAIGNDDDGLYFGIANGGTFTNDRLTFKLRVDRGFVYTTEHINLRAYDDKLYFTDFTTGGERERNISDLISELKNGTILKVYVSYEYGNYSMKFPLTGSESAINKLLEEIK
jgi:hypothetical protein